ncbi:MAG: amidase, partial [Myxococcales bacterium]|nr:amidase [Myxococcales bacterium]
MSGAFLSIDEAAGLVARKKLSPVELVDAALERIARAEPLGAFWTITAERARAEAKAAEAEIVKSGPRHALHGIPIAHKDLYDTAGVRTTAGASFYMERVPEADAFTVARLREAGAISVGKLAMHELAAGADSQNPHFPSCRNPWRHECSPGGSSGGSGVAVAAGLVFAATGSDTAGSIRIPASLCGCVGLKPTYGTASRRGLVPLSWSLDHAGPLARSVLD